MRRIVYILILLVVSCSSDNNNDNDNNDNNNQDPESNLVLLFPDMFPITSIELENGNSLVFYENQSLFISEIDSLGNIIWTQQHNYSVDSFSNTIFLFNNFIYAFFGSNGINKLVFDLNGELIENEMLSTENDYHIVKDNNSIYALKVVNSSNQINYKKYSLTGNLVNDMSFDIGEIASYSNVNLVKNDKIYLFGESDFQDSPNFYENYFCKIYNMNGDLINTINTEITGEKRVHSKLVLDNGNIIMSTYLFNPSEYDIRLFDENANLLSEISINPYSPNLRMNLLSNNKIAIAGTGGSELSDTNAKASQFTVYDSALNSIYTENIGGYDGGDVFFNLNESNQYYYLLGRTDASNGDFDLPNNSTTSDMFFFRLDK